MIAIAFNIVIVFAQYYRFLDEEFEDTKGAIRIRISKKNRQHNGQKKQDKRTKKRSTKHTYTTKDNTLEWKVRRCLMGNPKP